MAFMQQVGFGGMNFNPMMMLMGGGGMNFLFGNMMGGGMPGFGGGGMDMNAMYQMMAQMMGQGGGAQYAGGGAMQPGAHYPVWQNQLPQNQYQQAAQGTGDARQFNPNQADSPYQQYTALKAHATANGSQDGTPIADWTSVQQDIGAAQFAGQLASKQAGVLGQAIERSTPEEQATLKAEEERLAAMFKQSADQGNPLTQHQRDYLTSHAIDNLYSSGKVGAGIGDANRQYLELNKYQSQTEANLYLKWGQPLPAGASAAAVNASPFNANNRQAAQA